MAWHCVWKSNISRRWWWRRWQHSQIGRKEMCTNIETVSKSNRSPERNAHNSIFMFLFHLPAHVDAFCTGKTIEKRNVTKLNAIIRWQWPRSRRKCELNWNCGSHFEIVREKQLNVPASSMNLSYANALLCTSEKEWAQRTKKYKGKTNWVVIMTHVDIDCGIPNEK